jgi:hypothetical protein
MEKIARATVDQIFAQMVTDGRLVNATDTIQSPDSVLSRADLLETMARKRFVTDRVNWLMEYDLNTQLFTESYYEEVRDFLRSTIQSTDEECSYILNMCENAYKPIDQIEKDEAHGKA